MVTMQIRYQITVQNFLEMDLSVSNVIRCRIQLSNVTCKDIEYGRRLVLTISGMLELGDHQFWMTLGLLTLGDI